MRLERMKDQDLGRLRTFHMTHLRLHLALRGAQLLLSRVVPLLLIAYESEQSSVTSFVKTRLNLDKWR